MMPKELTTEIIRSIIASEESDWFDISIAEAEDRFDSWLACVKQEARDQALDSLPRT